MHALCDLVLSYARNHGEFESIIRVWGMKFSVHIPKYEHFTSKINKLCVSIVVSSDFTVIPLERWSQGGVDKTWGRPWPTLWPTLWPTGSQIFKNKN